MTTAPVPTQTTIDNVLSVPCLYLNDYVNICVGLWCVRCDQFKNESGGSYRCQCNTIDSYKQDEQVYQTILQQVTNNLNHPPVDPVRDQSLTVFNDPVTLWYMEKDFTSKIQAQAQIALKNYKHSKYVGQALKNYQYRFDWNSPKFHRECKSALVTYLWNTYFPGNIHNKEYHPEPRLYFNVLVDDKFQYKVDHDGLSTEQSHIAPSVTTTQELADAFKKLYDEQSQKMAGSKLLDTLFPLIHQIKLPYQTWRANLTISVPEQDLHLKMLDIREYRKTLQAKALTMGVFILLLTGFILLCIWFSKVI